MRSKQTDLQRRSDVKAGTPEPVDGKGRRPELDIYTFQGVYDAYFKAVARWIRVLRGPVADQDDLIQEVFMIVYRRLPDFDGRNLVGWLYRITANQVRDYRRLVWIKHIFRGSVARSSEMPAATPTPIAAFETHERQRTLEHLLSKLSDRLRVTFMLFEIEGYTAEEIAEMEAVSVNTVRARIYRARKKLTVLIESSVKSDLKIE